MKKIILLSIYVSILLLQGCVASRYQTQRTIGSTTIYCSSSGCQIQDRNLGSVRLEKPKKINNHRN